MLTHKQLMKVAGIRTRTEAVEKLAEGKIGVDMGIKKRIPWLKIDTKKYKIRAWSDPKTGIPTRYRFTVIDKELVKVVPASKVFLNSVCVLDAMSNRPVTGADMEWNAYSPNSPDLDVEIDFRPLLAQVRLIS